jgi:DNA-binding transcriptional regulator LsrR (DeoR family)
MTRRRNLKVAIRHLAYTESWPVDAIAAELGLSRWVVYRELVDRESRWPSDKSAEPRGTR